MTIHNSRQREASHGRSGPNLLRMVLLAVLAMYFWPWFVPQAYGYLDPGTGSYILQILVGGLLGGLFVLGLLWRRVIAFFRRLFSGSRKDEHPDN